MNAASILSNLVFSIGGFLLGFAVARIKQQVEEVSEVIVEEDKPVTITPHRSRLSWRQALGTVVLLLAVGSTIVSAIAASDQRESADRLQRIAACQAEFNKAYRLALVERGEAVNQERQSTREMWGVLLDPAATEATRRAAATKFYNTLNEGDKTRAANPLPTNDRCE